MTLEAWMWTAAIFLLGFLAGGLVWIPLTLKRQQQEFQERLHLARAAKRLNATR